MSKDPAILFYTSDFITGTMTMTDEQVGKYIRLLCLQHQKGHLTEKDMMFVCKTYDVDLFAKFVKDDNGCFYNERMEAEIIKRVNYSKSRSENRKKKQDMLNICKTYDKHMENENENENINKDIDLNTYKFYTKTGVWYIPLSLFHKLEYTYPHVDIDQQLKSAALWTYTNTSQRKTNTGMPAFLRNWLNRCEGKSEEELKREAKKTQIIPFVEIERPKRNV